MNRTRMASWLVAAYPAAWRREYGEELRAILASGPITLRIAANVIVNGVWLRARATQPSTLLGLVAMVMLFEAAISRANGLAQSLAAMVRPTSMTFPTVEVRFLSSEVYVWLLVGCGFWTAWRYGLNGRSPAWAAARMSIIAGFPVVLGWLLAATGAAHVSLAGTGAEGLSPLSAATAPLIRLPYYAIWGAAGGQLGRWILRLRLRPTPS